MIIISETDVEVPVTVIDAALRCAFPGAETKPKEISATGVFPHLQDTRFIEVTPQGEPIFSVRFDEKNRGFSLDGLDDQNLKAVVAIRSVLPGAVPLIAVQVDTSSFRDLTPGITVDELKEGWQSWDDLDQFVWL